MVTLSNFQSSKQGRTFIDVINDSRINFQKVIDFFNDPVILTRMEDSELHHQRPPLAGVIIEFESLPDVHVLLNNNDAHSTVRFRQAVGVLVKLHMGARGWVKSNVKGSLGKRANVQPRTTTAGAYHNKQGLSQWFTRAERYKK